MFASSVAGANVAKDAVCLTTESYTSPTGTMMMEHNRYLMQELYGIPCHMYNVGAVSNPTAKAGACGNTGPY